MTGMTSGHAIATLVVFTISTFFVIYPVSIPTPCPIPRISLNLTTAPILAIVLLWATRCIDPEVIRHGIMGTASVELYSVLVIFFSLAYISTTLDITGVLQATVSWVSNRGAHNGWKPYLYFYVMLTLFSVPLGVDPAAFSGTVYLVHYTRVANLNPNGWIMTGFAAVNTASMVLSVGNPTNMFTCGGLGVNNAAFTVYTILPFLACAISCLVTFAFQFRTQISQKVTHVAQWNPQTKFLDPVGAWVGGLMLVVTLILCLVVSFFGIDVWMVCLPFAVIKLLFDLALDHYRFSRGIPMFGRGLPKEVVGADEEPMVCKNRCVEEAPMRTPSTDEERLGSSPGGATVMQACSETPPVNLPMVLQTSPTTAWKSKLLRTFRLLWTDSHHLHDQLDRHFPTFINAVPRLPFSLIPIVLSQTVFVEALDRQGWINLFASWFVRASGKQLHPTIWLTGTICVVLCNISGTNIGATILLIKIIRAAALPYDVSRGAAIALAVASNVGAVNVTFSASLSGLRWRAVLREEGVHIGHRDFALWNLLPLLVMITAGLGIVSAEMVILFRS